MHDLIHGIDANPIKVDSFSFDLSQSRQTHSRISAIDCQCYQKGLAWKPQITAAVDIFRCRSVFADSDHHNR